MEEEYIPIGEAARRLGVSISSLRRWDESGRLPAVRKSPDGNRYYREIDLELFPNDLFQMAFEWATATAADTPEIPPKFYCQNKATFQARLGTMERLLAVMPEVGTIFPLVVAVAGEIGGNSFDHNIGQWPDIPGTFFGYHLELREIVLADRGLGVLATLKNALPQLADDQGALEAAFTQVVSGRAPESRGNGLKFVRQVVAKNLISLVFQSGEAELEIKRDSEALDIRRPVRSLRGCIAFIKF